jgi:hypothetical protein
MHFEWSDHVPYHRKEMQIWIEEAVDKIAPSAARDIASRIIEGIQDHYRANGYPF